MDNLIKENQSLKHSLHLVDSSITTAEESAQALLRQNSVLSESKNAVFQIISGIPLIGDLTNKISVKRKKDRLILGSIIGFLMFFIVWYLFG